MGHEDVVIGTSSQEWEIPEAQPTVAPSGTSDGEEGGREDEGSHCRDGEEETQSEGEEVFDLPEICTPRLPLFGTGRFNIETWRELCGLEDEEILLEMMPEPPVRNGDDFVLNSVHVADLDPGVDEFLLESDRTTMEPAGYAYVTFMTPRMAEVAIYARNFLEVLGKEMRLSLARKNLYQGWALENGIFDPKCNIFVGSLDSSFTSHDLFQLFYSFGDIASVKVSRYRGSGESKGYGFVGFRTEEAARNAAMEMNKCYVLGKCLRVEMAHQVFHRSGSTESPEECGSPNSYHSTSESVAYRQKKRCREVERPDTRLTRDRQLGDSPEGKKHMAQNRLRPPHHRPPASQHVVAGRGGGVDPVLALPFGQYGEGIDMLCRPMPMGLGYYQAMWASGCPPSFIPPPHMSAARFPGSSQGFSSFQEPNPFYRSLPTPPFPGSSQWIQPPQYPWTPHGPFHVPSNSHHHHAERVVATSLGTPTPPPEDRGQSIPSADKGAENENENESENGAHQAHQEVEGKMPGASSNLSTRKLATILGSGSPPEQEEVEKRHQEDVEIVMEGELELERHAKVQVDDPLTRARGTDVPHQGMPFPSVGGCAERPGSGVETGAPQSPMWAPGPPTAAMIPGRPSFPTLPWQHPHYHQQHQQAVHFVPHSHVSGPHMAFPGTMMPPQHSLVFPRPSTTFSVGAPPFHPLQRQQSPKPL